MESQTKQTIGQRVYNGIISIGKNIKYAGQVAGLVALIGAGTLVGSGCASEITAENKGLENQVQAEQIESNARNTRNQEREYERIEKEIEDKTKEMLDKALNTEYILSTNSPCKDQFFSTKSMYAFMANPAAGILWGREVNGFHVVFNKTDRAEGWKLPHDLEVVYSNEPLDEIFAFAWNKKPLLIAFEYIKKDKDTVVEYFIDSNELFKQIKRSDGVKYITRARPEELRDYTNFVKNLERKLRSH